MEPAQSVDVALRRDPGVDAKLLPKPPHGVQTAVDLLHVEHRREVVLHPGDVDRARRCQVRNLAR